MQNYFYITLLTILGASLGSFLNVVAHRTINNKPWWGNERSICENCKHTLKFIDLIPVFSWLLLKGKCRYCNSKISVKYILVEIVNAALFGFIAFKLGFSKSALLAYIGSCSIILNSLTDIETGEIFDLYALSFGLIAVIIRITSGFDYTLDGILGAAVGWGIFAVIILLSRGGMGWGDATFMAGMGAVLGWKLNLLAFYIGVMFGGVCVILLILIGKIHWGKGETVPLVPFLSVGCYVTMLYGNEILKFIIS